MNLKQIEEEIEKCKKCSLEKTRKNSVPGEGDSGAEIMLIGEAPGSNEDRQGVPFVGAAGKILDELLDSIKLPRNKIYITNIVKCRPPNNRNPSKEEIKTCSPYLDRQLEIINPSVIGCMGNFATGYILTKFGLRAQVQGISKIHSKIFNVPTLTGTIKIIPLYHPAVATYDRNMLGTLKEDFRVLKNFA